MPWKPTTDAASSGPKRLDIHRTAAKLARTTNHPSSLAPANKLERKQKHHGGSIHGTVVPRRLPRVWDKAPAYARAREHDAAGAKAPAY